jgi:hypothetical protein
MIEKKKPSTKKVAKKMVKRGATTASKVPTRPTPKSTSIKSKVSQKKVPSYGGRTWTKYTDYNTSSDKSKAPKKPTLQGTSRATAKKVPTKIATGVKRSMTFGDAYGLRKAINTGKMSNVNKEVNSMKSRRVNKATTRYKK